MVVDNKTDSATQREIDVISEQLYQAVWLVLDSVPSLSGDEAGRVATRCEQVAKLALRRILS